MRKYGTVNLDKVKDREDNITQKINVESDPLLEHNSEFLDTLAKEDPTVDLKQQDILSILVEGE